MEKTVKKVKKSNYETNTTEMPFKKILNFYQLKSTNSKIACHGKPKYKEISQIKLMYGVNFVYTLLKPKEKPEEIQECCKKSGIDWDIIQLEGANVAYFRKKETQKMIIDGLLTMYQKLKNENLVVFLHCAAGLHRTGTILYCILRMFDETPESALNAIQYIRPETRKEVGAERIMMAEALIVPKLLEKIGKLENSENIIDSININK